MLTPPTIEFTYALYNAGQDGTITEAEMASAITTLGDNCDGYVWGKDAYVRVQGKIEDQSVTVTPEAVDAFNQHMANRQAEGKNDPGCPFGKILYLRDLVQGFMRGQSGVLLPLKP